MIVPPGLKNILLGSRKSRMMAYMAEDPAHFTEAVKLVIEGEPDLAWRAAWMVGCCMEENDKRVRKYVKDLIHILQMRKGGEQREIMKIIYKMKVSGDLEGLLFDRCMAMWENLKLQSSVRFYAFKILCKIGEGHPELNREIEELLQPQYTETLSPAIRKSVYKLAKDINATR